MYGLQGTGAPCLYRKPNSVNSSVSCGGKEESYEVSPGLLPKHNYHSPLPLSSPPSQSVTCQNEVLGLLK